VHALLAAKPDLTIAEPRRQAAADGIAVSSSSGGHFLAAEQDWPDVAAARRAWRAQRPDLKPERLVFIDETWATTNLSRRHGRARGGQQLGRMVTS
jgi:hypothetical protein